MATNQQSSGITRRQFIRRAGLGAAALGASALGLGGIARAYTQPGGDPFCSGGVCLCPFGEVAVTSPAPGVPTDPSVLTAGFAIQLWAGEPEEAKAQIRDLFYFNPYFPFWMGAYGILHPYFPFHWMTGMHNDPSRGFFGTPYEGAPLEAVKKPADFPGEGIQNMDSRTYRVEVEMPAGPYELPNPTHYLFFTYGLFPYEPQPLTKVKIRGWYIKGIRDPEEPGALVIMQPGRTVEFTAPAQLIAPTGYVVGVRELAYQFALSGFDVWLSDKRGHGVSDGVHSGDNIAMADDVFRAMKRFETGEGLRVMDSGDTASRELEPGENLLPYNTAEETPLILWGSSQGSGIMMYAMAKHTLAKYGQIATKDGPVSFADVYPDEAANIGFYRGFDMRGMLHVDGVSLIPSDYYLAAGILYLGVEWPFDYAPWAGQPLPSPPFPSGMMAPPFPADWKPEPSAYGPSFALTFESMAYWPAIMWVHGAIDEGWSPAGCVAAYNKARGQKSVVLVKDAKHSGPLMSPETRPYVIASLVKFATKALNYNGALSNTKQTTLQKEACKAAQLSLSLEHRNVPSQGVFWKDFLNVFNPEAVAKIEGYAPKQP